MIRSETSWLRDGNVVLQVANRWQFRVHWSVLALNSTVFRDIEGLPQPVGEPTVEGCPVVKLEDDLEDVEYLLKALYIPTFHSQKVLPLAVIGAFIRVGRKYKFKDLFESAVARLTFEFPTTLAEYDALPVGLTTIQSYSGVTFDIIAFASRNHISSVLPYAYCYVTEDSTPGELFDGTEREDGTRASLPPVDLRRCLVGRERLLVKQFEPGYTFGWARKWLFYDCVRVAQWHALREDIVKTYLYDVAGGTGSTMAALAGDEDERDFCDSCTPHIHDCMAAGRKKIWEELPGIFDLPPWSELKNDM
ncbi:hypothetical protein C8R45DRAFT_1034982 [Mycena sanguinolenta]|nr:hypothetical protein C8R45DRAFT_1034982 [Mycena sanguinolenta]